MNIVLLIPEYSQRKVRTENGHYAPTPPSVVKLHVTNSTSCYFTSFDRRSSSRGRTALLSQVARIKILQLVSITLYILHVEPYAEFLRELLAAADERAIHAGRVIGSTGLRVTRAVVRAASWVAWKESPKHVKPAGRGTQAQALPSVSWSTPRYMCL